MIDTHSIKNYLLDLQNRLCTCLSAEDGQSFQTDHWERAQGGGGITCVLENGVVLEKAGVNFSEVFGTNLPVTATAHRPELANCDYQAMGVSSVIHPRNPYAPTAHMNVRFFMAKTTTGKTVWWFGGGFDLTPYYGFVEDCQHFHQQAYLACQPFGAEIYPRYKKWADDYFYLKHRQEPRGIGGIFFDDLNEWEFARCFEFIQTVGNRFIAAYQPILQKRKIHAYTTIEKEFQRYRRGRYVEFNLVYDRGTLFGLQSNGRTESILMSLPPEVSWRYQQNPVLSIHESQLLTDFLTTRDWLNITSVK